MKRSLNLLIIFLSVFGVMAFQCSSTELTSAKLYIQQKNYDKALEALEKEVEKNPKSDEGYYLLGFILGEKGNIEEMMKSFDKSLSISNKFEKSIHDNKLFYWQQSFNKGVSFFNKASKTSDQDSIAMHYDSAIKSFEEAIMLQPDSADTYKNLVYACLNANRIDDAILPLEKLLTIKKTPDSYSLLGEIYANKGTVLMNEYGNTKNVEDSTNAMGYFDKAIKVLEEGRSTFPDDKDILLILSNTYVSADKADIAMDAFKQGVQQDPENKYYRYNYGVLLLGANQFEEATTQFTKAVEIDPAYENAIYNLAVTYVKWGTAIREEAEAKGEDDPTALEKYKLALPYLEKVVEIKSDEAAIWELLGKVYAVLGESTKSQEAFDKADALR